MTKEKIRCPDCGIEIEYDVKHLPMVVEMWVPGACPNCGVCLK